MNEHFWWYVARAGGIVAWALVSASVLFGLWVSLRLTRRPRPNWVLDVHRFLGALSVVFVGVHLAGLVADSYVQFGLNELFVPLASAWKPVAVAWGVVALYLLLAVEATSLVMKRLPRRLWRAVHLTSYATFVLSTVHTLTAGTERTEPALQWATLVVSAAVVFLTIARVLGGRRASAEGRIPRRVVRQAPSSPAPAPLAPLAPSRPAAISSDQPSMAGQLR